MSYRLKIKPDAEDDAQESAFWYNAQRENLGAEFLEEIEAVLKLIKNNPFLIQVKYRNVRVAHSKKFPFGVYYVVEEIEIFVIAILHNSRNPKIWKKRV